MTSRSTAADKLLQVLLAFEEEPQWALGRLAARLELPKSTVHRILVQLKAYDLVEQDGEGSGLYRLGLRAWRLAHSARPYEHLRRTARPYLDALSQSSLETVFLTVAEGMHSICIDRIEGPQGVRMSLDLHSAAPLHRGASNLILLAFLTPAQRRAAVAYWQPGAAAGAELERDLAAIRQDGYVYTVAQLTAGAAALAVPVLDSKGGLITGISISGPAERFTRSRALQTLPSLRAAADEIRGYLESASPAASAPTPPSPKETP